LTETVKDNVQVYNLPKFDGYHKRAQPPVLQDHIKEIENFSRKCHSEVVVKLLRLFAIILELPDEDQLVKDHEYALRERIISDTCITLLVHLNSTRKSASFTHRVTLTSEVSHSCSASLSPLCKS
jgi:hypothetical protein